MTTKPLVDPSLQKVLMLPLAERLGRLRFIVSEQEADRTIAAVNELVNYAIATRWAEKFWAPRNAQAKINTTLDSVRTR